MADSKGINHLSLAVRNLALSKTFFSRVALLARVWIRCFVP